MNVRFSAVRTQIIFNKIKQNQSMALQTGYNQSGSIILIVLMLLVMMSIIGIASINTTVTESFIVRNDAIRKQNVQMVDAVACEATQMLIDAGLFDSDSINPDLIDPEGASLDWVNPVVSWDWTNWYDSNFQGRVLDTTNSTVPRSLAENTGIGVVRILENRNEWDPATPVADASPLRYAMVGWGSAPGSSIKMTTVTRRSARVLTEYVSPDYGVIRLTIGLERDFF